MSNKATCLEYFGKLLSLDTVCRCIMKCNSNLYYARRKLYICSMQRSCQVLSARAHLRWSKRQWKCVMWSDESKFQLVLGKKQNRLSLFSVPSSQSQRRKGETRLSSATSANLSLYGDTSVYTVCVTCICWKVTLMWRHTVYWDCTETYSTEDIFTTLYYQQEDIFPGKQDNAMPHAAQATTDTRLSRHS